MVFIFHLYPTITTTTALLLDFHGMHQLNFAAWHVQACTACDSSSDIKTLAYMLLLLLTFADKMLSTAVMLQWLYW